MQFDMGQSFDTVGSLAALYLWLMFGYLTVLLNCDLQRLIQEHQIVRHVLGIVAFYFLFTVIDPNNTAHVAMVLFKTVVVYTLFVLATKSKWQFALAILVLMVIDQMLKNHISYLEKNNKLSDETKETLKKVRKYILYVILAVIAVGIIDYYRIQKNEYKNNFDWSIFVLGTGKCKKSV